MKVFFSWSGEASKAVAKALKQLIMDVFSSDVTSWMSDIDIEAGRPWQDSLDKELKSTSIGVVCIVPNNLQSPWLLFEAGAIFKAVNSSKVIPYCVGLPHSSIKGPLSSFQVTSANEEGTLKLVQSINSSLEKNTRSSSDLQRAFDKWWPELKGSLETISKSICRVPSDQLTELHLYGHEKDAEEDIRRCASQSSMAKILLVRGRHIVSDSGLFSDLSIGGKLENSGMVVQSLLFNIVGENRAEFNKLSKSINVSWSSYDQELEDFKNRMQFISNLKKTKSLSVDARVYSLRHFPFLKLLVFDEQAFFTFYHQLGVRYVADSGLFRVDKKKSPSLYRMLINVFRKVWEQSIVFDNSLIENREKVVISVAIRTKLGLLLLRRRKPYSEIGSGKGEWELPGGKIELQEGPLDTLSKELREEIGLDMVVSPKLMGAFKYVIDEDIEKSYRLHLLYELRIEALEPTLSEEHDAFSYIGSEKEINDLQMNDQIRRVVKQILSDSDFPVDGLLQ